MKTQTISIIGLNRVGASIGLALKKSNLEVTIVGHDRDTAVMRDAKDVVGAVDKTEWNMINAAMKADILVVTVPHSELELTLQAIGKDLQEHTVIIDLTSQKRAGLNWAKQYVTSGHYIGAVPLFNADSLADGRSAIETADADLFRKSVFCMVPSADVDPQAVETAVNFGLILGATPYFVDPDEYDQLSQGTETMPGLLAAAVFGALHKSTGWRDMLRLAGLPFSVSTSPLATSVDAVDTAMTNKAATLRWLDAVMGELQQMRRWIYDDEGQLLTAYLEELQGEWQQWLRQREKNDWAEMKTTHIPNQSFTEQMLGTMVTDRFKKDKDE
ncbi:MAG: prephenate dehydrogenase [Chloroflexi bacterium]|nr:MAG: prephenate dehydrogenase [Chloroflexota bacterium]